MGITAAYMVPHPPLIVPEVGRGEEKKIQNTVDAYHELGRRIGEEEPETIVLISPHQTMYADYFHISPGQGAMGDFSRFGAAQEHMEVSYDTEFVKQLSGLAEENNFPAGTLGEKEIDLDHGTMVPLYFVNKYWKNYRLVRIGLSGLPFVNHYELGMFISETAEALGRKAVLIASGDLSHCLKEDGPYGFRKEGPKYDKAIMDIMGGGNFLHLLDFSEDFCAAAGECGHRSFVILAGALDKRAVKSQSLSYEGPFGVGYGICSYEVLGEEASRNFMEQYVQSQRKKLAAIKEGEDSYVCLARNTVEEYVLTGKKPAVPQGLLEEMYGTKAGVFVSIKKQGRLRGCIGTIQSVYGSVAQEIIENAVSAASKDPRFHPITPEELEYLTITVDVLGETEQIDSPGELDVERYGVIVTKGGKRGLLLPNLEGVDSVEEQIAIAKQKAGIPLEEEVFLERFEVVRHF
ncbi:MAG: AmmeMemoRadiSam system protein A [Lachnospiraceae bacterium]|nr:AmmeMemoRadiSam system protein A [Lachnospiraceae bacterium]